MSRERVDEIPYPLPPASRLVQIGPDFLLGHWFDPFVVEHIRLYERVRTARSD